MKYIWKLISPVTSTQEKLILIFRYKLMFKLITPFLKIPKDKRYIFIVGCYGSGTTLLNHLLGFHKEISGLPTEGTPLTDELIAPEDVGWNRIVHKALPILEEHIKSSNPHRLKKQWGLFHDKSKTFFLEKSPSNWTRIEWLANHFEDSWFIWIIRNGYAVSEGLRRRSLQSRKYTADQYPNGFPIELCAREWCIGNQTIENQLKKIKNKIFLTYENLTENCEETLKELLIKLPLTGKTIEVPKNFSFHGEMSDISNKNKDSIARLSARDIEAINSIAYKTLKKYNYEVIVGSSV